MRGKLPAACDTIVAGVYPRRRPLISGVDDGIGERTSREEATSRWRQCSARPAAMEAAAPRFSARAALVGRSDRDHPSRRARSPAKRSAWTFSIPRPARSWPATGAIVTGERVRIGRDIIEAAIGTAPEEFTFHARNPRRSIRIGGNWIAFAPVGGPAQLLGPRSRPAPRRLRRQRQLPQAGQYFNCIHTAGGGSTDALDVHASIRHLRIGAEQGSCSPTRCCSPRRPAVPGCSTASRSRGSPAASTPEQFLREPSVSHDHQHQLAAEARRADGDGHDRDGPPRPDHHASRRSRSPAPWRRSPWPAPSSQQNAEALAGLALTQLARPGAPVHLWRLHLQRRHEVRRAGLRHAGIHEGAHRRRPAGAALQAALPHLQHLRRQRGRCPGRL